MFKFICRRCLRAMDYGSELLNYESFISSVQEIALVCNLDGKIIFANKAVTDKLGYTDTEIKKMHVLNLHPEENRAEASEIVADIFAGRTNICPLPLLKKNGTILPVETHAWLGKWDGEIRMFSLSQDLSKDQESLQKLTKIFERVPTPMLILSLDKGEYVDANRAFFDRFGIKEEQLIGRTAADLHFFIDKMEYTRTVAELRKKGYFDQKVVRMKTEYGEELVGLFSGEIINAQDKKYVMTTMIDLTKQTQVEDELLQYNELQQVLLELASRYINMSLGDYATEIENSLKRVGKFVGADRVYIFNYDFSAGTTSNTYEWCNYNIVPEIENLQNIDLDTIPDWVFKHKNGEAFIVEDINLLDSEESAVRAILEPQGVKSLITIPLMLQDECLGFVGFDSVKNYRIYTKSEVNLLKFYAQILANIHLRRNRDIALQEAEFKAVEASRAKNIFIAKMSHELRNPLNGAWGFLNLIDDELEIDKKTEYLENSKKALHTAIQLANDLLDISKIESNSFEFIYSVINIKSLISESVEMYQSEIKSRGISLRYKIDNKLPAHIIGDFEKLKQMIGNLLSNAILHAHASQIEIGCNLVERQDNQVRISFFVKDNGIGISPKEQKQLFEYFYKKQTSSPGTGLGLAVVRDLVVKMDGELKLDSTEDVGSTFTFTLTLLVGESEENPIKNQLNCLPSLDNVKILIAEDDLINQSLIYEMLKRKGIIPTVVENGLEMINQYKQKKYDVLLVDIHMPVMGGLETAKKIREMDSQVPIIALTAAVLPEEKESYYAAGINKIVEKPIAIDTLLKTISEVLAQPE